MNTDEVEPSENEGSDAGHPPGSAPSSEVTPPNEDERQERGRASMDRWSLHKTLMEDLEWELEAKNASDPRPPDPDHTEGSDPSVP